MNGNKPSKATALAKVHPTFAKHVGPDISELPTDKYSLHARPDGKYFASNVHDTLSFGAITTCEPTYPLGVFIAIRRNDLEYGEQPIRLSEVAHR